MHALVRLRIFWLGVAVLVAVVLGSVAFCSPIDLLPPQLQGWRTVGSYFDRPPGYPGKTWTRDGRAVSSDELEAIAGPSHCGWQSATFLFIGWPPGTKAGDASQGRQYIRDPAGSVQLPDRLLTWARNPTLPPDAMDTGYRYGLIKLYLATSDEDQYAYVVAPADRERWPRSSPMTLCS